MTEKKKSGRAQLLELLAHETHAYTQVVGVEVGTCRGEFSEQLLTAMPNLTLISVDYWAHWPGLVDLNNVSDQEHLSRLWDTRRRLARFGERSVLLVGSSLKAAHLIADHLDFVYIDAGHDYESVRRDLEAWHKKLVPSGGVLCGDDYFDGNKFNTDFGVRRAVDEFSTQHRRPVTVFEEEGDGALLPQWWIKL